VLRKGHILAILVIAISFVTVPVFAPNHGDLGSEHVHASISVIIHGDKFDFSGPAYQVKSNLIDFEAGDGTTIHRHATGIMTGFLFATIGIELDDECFSFQGSSGVRWFCTDDDYTLKFYINHQPVPNLTDYVFEDGDRILITYGVERLTPIASLLANLDAQPLVDEPAGMGFYENEIYDFSYSIPMDWLYQENYLMPDGSTFQVMTYPERFSPVGSIFDAPIVFVKYESIPEATIPYLNEKSIEKYELEKLRIALPNAKILNYDIKSTPWGWESTLDVVVSLNIPFVVQGEFHEKDTVFYFKEREAYTVGYVSPTAYYDSYLHVYEDAIDSMVINGIVVPEFQEIAMMVLASSIVLVIVFARKFSKFQLSENS